MAKCPTCDKEVDPLRAPSARVIGGKIVAFCSAACANAGTEASVAAVKARVADAAPEAKAADKPAAKAADKPAARGSMLDELEQSRAPARAPKSTTPIVADDVVEERAAPSKRARTEPPRPPPSTGTGTRLATAVE